MSKLISGKEALIALANGEEVLFRNKSTGDTNHAKYQTAECIQNGYYEYCGERIYLEFFIKPRTITINGIELAPCYAVGIDHTKNEVSIQFHNNEDAVKLNNLLLNIYGFRNA